MLKKVPFILISFILLFHVSFAQNNDSMKSITVDGKNFYFYTVEAGEGFFAIEKKFNISQNDIIQYNPNSKDGLKAGQVLKIPAPNTHIVEGGETVYSISKKYNITVDDIYTLNPSAKEKITIGSALNIPSASKLITASTENIKKETTKPQVQTEQKKIINSNYITHEVLPSETLYSISKKYNTSISEIILANPVLEHKVLQSGMTIRILPQNNNNVTKQNTTRTNTEYFFHKVAPKEALYGISKYYDVPQDTVKAINPNINFDQLPIGTEVKLPINNSNKSLINKPKEYIYYTVPKKISLKRLADQFNTTQDVLKELNPGYVKGKINANVVIRVPNEAQWKDATSLDSTDIIEDNSEDSIFIITHSDESVNEVKIAILLPFAINDTSFTETLKRKSSLVEFYGGAIIAANKLISQGIPVKLTVYDIGNGNISKVLKDPNLLGMNIIIGPPNSSQIKLIAEFAKQNKIMLALPFRTSTNFTNENPYIIQMSMTPKDFAAIASQKFVSLSSVGNIVIVDPTTSTQDFFTNKLTQEVTAQNNKNYSQVKISRIDITNVNTITSKLSLAGPNYVFIASNKIEDISRALPQIRTALIKSKSYKIQLIGFPDWPYLKGINLDVLHQYDFTSLSPYFIDYSSPKTINFLKEYRKAFNTEPNNNYTNYGIYGYDLINYFGTIIHKNGKFYQEKFSTENFEGLGSKFNLEQPNLWSGFINKGMYLIQYTPDYEIKVLNGASNN